MKSINVVFDDKDYLRLVEAKGELSWRSFILKLVEKRVEGASN